MQILSCIVVFKDYCIMLNFLQNYFKFSAIHLTNCNVILCAYFVHDKSIKFIKYLSS